jgi:spore coat polysaccharide biosynthesis protein SpsF (cytidylyltransferase family)
MRYASYKNDLAVQVEYAQNQKQMALLESKELVNTNLGPEETMKLTVFKDTTKDLKKMKNKQELIDQAQVKFDHKKTLDQIERQQDVKWIEEDIQKMNEHKDKQKVI